MPSDAEWDRFTRESFERDRRQDERLADQGATLKSTVNLQATLVEVVKDLAPKEQADEIARIQKEQILPDLAIVKDRVMSQQPDDNSTAGALGGLSGLFKTALAGDVKALAVLLLGLPFTLFMLAFLLAAGLGNADGFIDGFVRLLHGPADKTEIVVEPATYPDSVDAVEIDAETVTLDTEGQ